MRFYLRSIAELAIEAVVLVRLLVAGRPDADALAAAGNPDLCPDFVEPIPTSPITELDRIYHQMCSENVAAEADEWLACMDPADVEAWIGGEWT